MSSAVRESDESKIARYTKQNNGGPLTDKQRARLGNPLAAQHAAIRAERPVTPQAAQKATVQSASVDAVVSVINANPHAGTWDITMASKERFEAQKQLDSARSKITRRARLSRVEVSTQKITREDGTIVLRVHIED